jgi:hypothetical protein
MQRLDGHHLSRGSGEEQLARQEEPSRVVAMLAGRQGWQKCDVLQPRARTGAHIRQAGGQLTGSASAVLMDGWEGRNFNTLVDYMAVAWTNLGHTLCKP